MLTPDFHAAANRHYDDGLLLSGNGRLPGADHFFGIAAECAIKAALQSAGVLKLDAEGKPCKPCAQHCPGIWAQYQILLEGSTQLSRFPLPKTNPFDQGNWNVSDRYSDGSAITQNLLSLHRLGAFAALKLLGEVIRE